MKRYVIFEIAAIVLTLYGCGRGHATQQQTVATTASDAAQEPMTIVDCLVPAAETPENRAVGTSGNPPPPSFRLVNVTTPVKGSAAAEFNLVADKDRLDDLQRFSNSRVEVSGSIVDSTSNRAPDVGAAPAYAGAPPGDARRIRVKDVRQLEPTCGAAKTK
ncbi:MAG TPA: hypothetical protein VH138_10815 [Vicinamibacterales bacterium]|jgi:hypothetical protein|nr:hypothetical protein [Vicinamibacterales bacterium]